MIFENIGVYYHRCIPITSASLTTLLIEGRPWSKHKLIIKRNKEVDGDAKVKLRFEEFLDLIEAFWNSPYGVDTEKPIEDWFANLRLIAIVRLNNGYKNSRYYLILTDRAVLRFPVDKRVIDFMGDEYKIYGYIDVEEVFRDLSEYRIQYTPISSNCYGSISLYEALKCILMTWSFSEATQLRYHVFNASDMIVYDNTGTSISVNEIETPPSFNRPFDVGTWGNYYADDQPRPGKTKAGIYHINNAIRGGGINNPAVYF